MKKSNVNSWLMFLVLVLLNATVLVAQTPVADFRRNDDAATVTTQPNTAPFRASLGRYGEVFVHTKPGLIACNAAATGTAAVTIIPAVAATSHYVSRVDCYNNSTVASVLTLNNNVTAVATTYIGTTTLGNNKAFFEFPHPVKGTVNTVISITPTTTATSTVCCANYRDVPNP